MHEQIKYD